MKRISKTLMISSVVLAVSSVGLYADTIVKNNKTNSEDLLAKLNRSVSEDGKVVSLSLQDVNTIANGFSLSLKIEGNISNFRFEFSEDIKNSSTYDVKVDKAAKAIDVYVTSKENLVKNSSINIGKVFVEGNENESYNIVDNTRTGKSSLILVTDTHDEKLKENLEEEGVGGFVIGATTTPPVNPNPPTNPPSTGGGGETTPSVPTTTVKELIGEDRYETAAKISKEGWNSADTVIIVNGHHNHLVDGLTATPLASAKNAPILLSDNKVLSKFTADEIKRLSPKNVIVIGGVDVMPQSIIDEVKKINSSISVKRIGGEDRYETSLNIAKEIDKTNNITKIYVGAGDGEADSLSIASVAGREKAPIILSEKDGLTKSTYDYIKSQNVVDGYVIGGFERISDKAMKNIDSVVSKDISGNRIYGNHRQETNAKVIEKFYKDTQLDGVIVAKEDNLVDALTVGPLGAKKDMPVVLATNEVNKMQEDILSKKKSPKVYEVGGGIKSSVIDKVKNMVNNRK